LIYFHDRWGLTATGIESSPVGASLTRRNAEMTQTPLRVIEADLFDPSIDDRFDVVWSGGLAEHFEDLAVPLARLRELVAPGGLLITAVPNLDGSLYARLTRKINPSVLRFHRVVVPSDLSKAYRDLGLDVEMVGYFGTWNLEVVNFGGHHQMQIWANRMDRGIGRVLGAVRARGESRWLSPYVVAVGRAPKTSTTGQPTVSSTAS
jgi:2-polyprenyl-6-hydroxyphenyl methylase/3-demethylubiquinone-9 3-methyltransferase